MSGPAFVFAPVPVSDNPHVALNNARNLPRPPVADVPEGELKLLWQLYTNLLERQARQSAPPNEKRG